MKTVADLFAKSDLAVMLCVASGGEEENITISKFSDVSSGKKIQFMTNIEQPFSPVSGEKVEATVGEETASFEKKKALAAFVCVGNCLSCQHDMYTTQELAAELDSRTINCVSCGEEVEVFYDGDLLADTAEGEDMGEDSEIVDSLEEEPSDEEDTIEDAPEPSDDEETPEEDAEESPEDEMSEEEPSEDGEGEDTVEEDTEDAPEDMAEEDAGKSCASEDVELATISVPMASLASYDERLRFATSVETAGQIELFVGNTHIGSLIREEASDSVQRIWDNEKALKSAFSKVFWSASQEIASGEATAIEGFGFNPVVVEVPVSQAVETLVAEKTAEATANVDEAVENAKDSVLATTKVAMAGIDKGVITGPSLVSEVASLLSRYGVANSSAVAIRFSEDFSSKFLDAVVAHAEDLRTKTPDYVAGLAKAIENSSYKLNTSATPAADLATAAALDLDINPVRKPANHTVANVSVEKPAGNAYSDVFRRMRHHR